MDLKGYALVTGAGSGIGRATAFGFAKEGCAGVAFSDINLKAAKEAAAASKAVAKNPQYKAVVIQADVTKKEQVQKMVDDTVKAFGRLDYAANCAGVYTNHQKPTSEVTEEDFDFTMNINLKGTLYCLQAQIEAMKKNVPVPNPYSPRRPAERGSIVLLGSVASWIGFPASMSYAVSKHAVSGLVKTAALDHANDLIRVNAVYPIWTKTPLLERAVEAVPKELKMEDRMKAMIPSNRMAEPDEVADAVIFLASPRSSFTTGTGITVDGG
ncbi:3-oxoacyl-reductase, partial [Kalaharituber pfeilii]